MPEQVIVQGFGLSEEVLVGGAFIRGCSLHGDPGGVVDTQIIFPIEIGRFLEAAIGCGHLVHGVLVAPILVLGLFVFFSRGLILFLRLFGLNLAVFQQGVFQQFLLDQGGQFQPG